MRILKSAVDDAYHYALACVCTKFGGGRLTIVYLRFLTRHVEQHTHICAHLHALHLVECCHSFNSREGQTDSEQAVGHYVAHFYAQRFQTAETVVYRGVMT